VSVTSRAEACQTGNDTILVVEDDSLVRNYVVTQVQALGYRTLSAGNAGEALAIFDSGESIDLLFTDVAMPGSINGRRLTVEALAKPCRKIELAKLIGAALAPGAIQDRD